MADTYTPNFNLIEPSIGGDVDTWGQLLNSNFDTIDTALASIRSGALPLAGGTLTGPLVLAADPAAAMQAATRRYVDNSLSGGTSGQVLLGAGNLREEHDSQLADQVLTGICWDAVRTAD